MSWEEDKEDRKEYYLKHVYGWKQRPCTACNGSGWYDNCDKKGRATPCSSCEGNGREKYKPRSDWMSKKNKSLISIHIDGNALLLNRSGKVSRQDPNVIRGCGVHIATKYKTKSKQKIKNELRGSY